MKKTLLTILALTTTAHAAWLMWQPVNGSTYKLTVRPLSGGDVVTVWNTTRPFLATDHLMSLSSNKWATSGVYTVEIVSMTSNAPDGKLQILLTNDWVNHFTATRPRPPGGLRVVQ